jgi:histidinol-phosphate aminotransferase
VTSRDPSTSTPPTTSDPRSAVEAMLRPDLRGRTAYGAPQLDVPVALNTNENSYPVPPVVVAAMTEALAGVAPGLNRYPDREFTRLRAALAGYLSRSGTAVSTEQVWAGNGSNEVLLHLLQAFGGPGRTALGFTPAYSMHPIITTTTGTTWVDGLRGAPGAGAFDLEAASAVDQVRRHRPHVVFLCSPNNPTGTALDLDVVLAVHDAAEGALVVVDEAYAEFARQGTPSALTLLPRHPRLIVTRTMSKAFAMAGTRLGYLAAHPAVVEALLLVRLPYHLSTLTQTAARVALRHRAELLGTVDALRRERDDTVAWLRDKGLTVADSDANFVLFGRFPDRRAVWEGLLARGVLIREVGPPQWLRVSIGTGEEMAAFRAALEGIL